MVIYRCTTCTRETDQQPAACAGCGGTSFAAIPKTEPEPKPEPEPKKHR